MERKRRAPKTIGIHIINSATFVSNSNMQKRMTGKYVGICSLFIDNSWISLDYPCMMHRYAQNSCYYVFGGRGGRHVMRHPPPPRMSNVVRETKKPGSWPRLRNKTACECIRSCHPSLHLPLLSQRPGDQGGHQVFVFWAPHSTTQYTPQLQGGQ